MFARATSGDKPNNNKFSVCSRESMDTVMRAKARHQAGCFIPMPGTCINPFNAVVTFVQSTKNAKIFERRLNPVMLVSIG